MAGSQRVGAVLHVDDAHQVEGFGILIGTIHIAHTVAVVENSFLHHLGHVLATHPGAIVTLVGVGIDEVGHVLDTGEVGLEVLDRLQGVLTVFQRRLDVEDDILDVATLVGLVAVFVLLIEGFVVGVGHHHGRIRDGGIAQGDDVSRGFHVLVLVILLGQCRGKEIRGLDQVVELGVEAVVSHRVLEVEPTVVILRREAAEVLDIVDDLVLVERAALAEALHHPLVRMVAHYLVGQLLVGDADASGFIFLGHDVFLDHLFQRAVVDAVGLG